MDKSAIANLSLFDDDRRFYERAWMSGVDEVESKATKRNTVVSKYRFQSVEERDWHERTEHEAFGDSLELLLVEREHRAVADDEACPDKQAHAWQPSDAWDGEHRDILYDDLSPLELIQRDGFIRMSR